MLTPDSRIYVAGHQGLIGSAVMRRLKKAGLPQIIAREHDFLDLTDALAVDDFFRKMKPEYVILAAGRVGGIVENQKYPADFITENLAIQMNVIKSAHTHGVKKLIFFGSSCMYPRECDQPMSENLLLTGLPEPTSMAYAIAKLAGVYMCLALNRQYGEKRFIPVIPNSAYGPYDNFDTRSGHVLSALICRFHEAKEIKAPYVTLWGTGKPRREFVHADDIADAALWLLNHDLTEMDLPVNIGVGYDYSIKDLARQIAEMVGYTGSIQWDVSKPDGAPRKLLDSSRIRKAGWKPTVTFSNGLKSTYEWYLRHVATGQTSSQQEISK